MAIEPITPTEAFVKSIVNIPDFVIQAVNDTIVKNLSRPSRTAYFTQDEVIGAILRSSGAMEMKLTSDKLFDNHWMDFEDAFRDAGWTVTYDKPAYNEYYPASFTFTAKK